MKTTFLMSICLLLLSYSCTVQAQLPDYNLGFEYWDSTTMVNDSASFSAYPAMHQIVQPYKGKLQYGWHSSTNYWRTTDAYAGKYALVLNQWYNGAKVWLLMGDCPNPGSNDSCRVAPAQKIYGVSGYYKFFPDSNAIGKPRLTIITYRINPATQTLQATGKDTLLFAPAQQYTAFNLYISDTATQPDSIAVRLDITGPFTTNIYSNFLYLDSLQLHYQRYSAGIPATGGSHGWKVYPNPARTVLYVTNPSRQPVHIALYNAEGRKLVATDWPAASQVDISQLPGGMYNVKIWDNRQELQAAIPIVIQH